MDFEANMGIPSIAMVLAEFYDQEMEKINNEGMPGLRIEWIRGPVWGKTSEQLRRDVVNGTSPISGKNIMREIVDHLTRPLTDDDKKLGTIERDRGPETYTDTPDNLQKLFLEKRFTDFLPVILPTEEKVAEMLKGTSHDPDEPMGRLAPTFGNAFEYWTFTVKDVAVNAVMAGCKPEYFPIVLAVASTNKEGISVSDNSFVEGLVINGTIRDEIGLNSGLGAMGPYAHANTTIGRAWSLYSINLGNCGKVGTTYMGTVGNPMNLINIVIAENEEDSPFAPLSVRKGFKKNENVVSLFEGWGVLSAKNWRANTWDPVMNYPETIKEIFSLQDQMFGAAAVLSPPIANFVRNAGFETIEKFKEFLIAGPDGQKYFQNPTQMEIIVTGGSNNNYFSIGGMRYGQSIPIDNWR